MMSKNPYSYSSLWGSACLFEFCAFVFYFSMCAFWFFALYSLVFFLLRTTHPYRTSDLFNKSLFFQIKKNLLYSRTKVLFSGEACSFDFLYHRRVIIWGTYTVLCIFVLHACVCICIYCLCVCAYICGYVFLLISELG